MFTLQVDKNKSQVTVAPRLREANPISDEPRSNSLWQSLALRPAGIQPKLSISQPGDAYEHEADRVADRVMRMAGPRSSDSELSISSDASLKAQRKCDQCEEEEGAKKLQRKGQGSHAESSTAVPAIVQQTLRAPGQPLDATTRAFMEPRFNCDFGDVRIHQNTRASTSAQAVNALAYTVGGDIVFGANQYAPTTNSGRTLIAHELAHVVQQRGVSPVLQRQACPNRPQTEMTQSRTIGGILPDNVIAAPNRIVIQDFAVSSEALPPGVTDHPEWQRAMSILVGDPSMLSQLVGYTDCTGSQTENLSLRRKRIAVVVAAMPAAARARILLNYALDASSFLVPNTTPEGRARNRAVVLQWVSSPPTGQQACDRIARRAANLDQYIFLVSCVELRLGLTTPADARTALSVVRQIYYGSGDWSPDATSVWDDVITAPPWKPGDDPTARLGATLMGALRASTEVEGIAVGHLFTGLDAMLNPHDVFISMGIKSGTNVPNEEFATWAGDVGSAAAKWIAASVLAPRTPPLDQGFYFTSYAGDDDLRGDLDAFAVRVGFNSGATPASRLGQTLHLTGTLSEALRQYYRMTSSALGQNRARATRQFIEAYGGVLSGTKVTNRAALAARLRPSVREFTVPFLRNALTKGYLNSAPIPPGAPSVADLLEPAIDAMIDRFITWLENHP